VKSELIWRFAVAALLGLTAFAVGVSNYYSAKPSEPQLYTVHFDGIDYQDLSRHWPDRGGSAYKTKAGKRIEFYGSFYEVEQ
jgi:hypothetical protein